MAGAGLLYELLASSGPLLALSWEWLRMCAHTMSLASPILPGRALRDWMPICTLPSFLSKATTGLTLQDGNKVPGTYGSSDLLRKLNRVPVS